MNIRTKKEILKDKKGTSIMRKIIVMIFISITIISVCMPIFAATGAEEVAAANGFREWFKKEVASGNVKVAIEGNTVKLTFSTSIPEGQRDNSVYIENGKLGYGNVTKGENDIDITIYGGTSTIGTNAKASINNGKLEILFSPTAYYYEDDMATIKNGAKICIAIKFQHLEVTPVMEEIQLVEKNGQYTVQKYKSENNKNNTDTKIGTDTIIIPAGPLYDDNDNKIDKMEYNLGSMGKGYTLEFRLYYQGAEWTTPKVYAWGVEGENYQNNKGEFIRHRIRYSL